MQTRIQAMMNQSVNIIKACQASTRNHSLEASSDCFGKDRPKTKVKHSQNFNQKNPNTQIQGYLQKLRSKKKKEDNNNFIRKSELGENQFTFTKAEELKLEIIDEFLEKGFDLPNSLIVQSSPITYPIKFQDQFQCSTDPIQNKDGKEGEEKVDMQEIMKQKILVQLNNLNKWGDEGNREKVTQNSDTFVRSYIESLDLSQFDKKKYRKKELQSINFHTVSNRLKSKEKLRRQKYSQTSLDIKNQARCSHPNKFKLLAPKILLSQFQSSPYLQYAERKKFLPIKELSQKNLSVQEMQTFKRKQKIAQVSNYLFDKYFEKKPNSIYMTDQRYQALYECQMIKGVKEIMDYKDYVNLQLTIKYPVQEGQESNEHEEHHKGHHQIFQSSPKHSMKQTLKDDELGSQFPKPKRKMEEIDKIIEKNRKRLKKQRQRVIQKLRC